MGALLLSLGFAAVAAASPLDDTTPVSSANDRVPYVVRANVLTPELVGRDVALTPAVQGAVAVENPTTLVGGKTITNFGYFGDGTMVPSGGAEATKSEPDKNTYLVFRGRQHGPDANYDYGRHFLFQGHEGGAGYLTRVNLDADAAHRVTLMAGEDVGGNDLPTFDGSTWDPFAGVILLTGEHNAVTGGVWQATPDYPSTVTDLSGMFGRGGFEGIQTDSDGNLWLVEDVGGGKGTTTYLHGRRPNSFIYRFVPNDPSDLTQGGKCQVLSVRSLGHAGAIVYDPLQSNDDAIDAQDVQDLHTYGKVFDTEWVTIHDTDVDGDTPFDANGLAKAAGGTPFKRPENGVFRPGDRFRSFFFTETGDTDDRAVTEGAPGAMGGLFQISQKRCGDDKGRLTLFYLSDLDHAGFDNICFLTDRLLIVAEDRGDTLHDQHDALDSIWMFDVQEDYGAAGAADPVRILAEGRDPSATADAGAGTSPLYQNDGDNEVTGIHVSDGDPTVNGLLGARKPKPFRNGWRVFWTQQHGDNTVWEIIERRAD